MPFKREGSPFYHYDRTITVDGQRHRIRGSTGARGKTEAREIEEQAVRDARRRLTDGPRRIPVTLDEALGRYILDVAADQPSLGTTKSQAKALLAGLGKTQILHDITTGQLIRHQTARRAAVANGTINRELELLRRVIAHVGQALHARLPEIEWSAIRLREPKERVRELSAAEEKRLFKALRPDFHPLVRFCLLVGCRVGNAIRLEWRDVDFESRTIVLREMKGGEQHSVPLSAGLAALLTPLLEQRRTYIRSAPLKDRPAIGDRVFLYRFRGSAKLRPFTIAGWKKPWWGALTAARVPDFRFHDTRHTALSRMTRVKGLKAAQRLAGHADISTTARYSHCEADELREAMERVERTHNTPTVVASTPEPAPRKTLKRRRKS